MLDSYRLPRHLKDVFNECARNPDYQFGTMLDAAIDAGYKKPNNLADILYSLFHHSDRTDGRFVPIKPHETEKIKEWNGWHEIAVRRLKHGPGTVKPRSKESEEASRAARKRKIIQYLKDAPISELRKTPLDGKWMAGIRDVLAMALEGEKVDATFERRDVYGSDGDDRNGQETVHPFRTGRQSLPQQLGHIRQLHATFSGWIGSHGVQFEQSPGACAWADLGISTRRTTMAGRVMRRRRNGMDTSRRRGRLS